MNNIFEKYKQSVEDYLQEMNFLYSGDILKSENKNFVRKLKHSSFSSEIMKDILIEVYNWSIEQMFEKSEEVIVHRNKFTDVYNLIDELGINPQLLFFSENTNINLGFKSKIDNDKPGWLPDYFQRKFKIMSSGVEIQAFHCPNIEDDVDDFHIYLVDKPIQSMVWSLQNMTYSITKAYSMNEHIVKFPIYHCDYKVWKIRIQDTQKIREEKINSILYDN